MEAVHGKVGHDAVVEVLDQLRSLAPRNLAEDT
jgi:hypothetical protein